MAADRYGTNTDPSIDALRLMLRSVQAANGGGPMIAVMDHAILPGDPGFADVVVDLRDDEPRAFLPSPPLGQEADGAGIVGQGLVSDLQMGAVFPSSERPTTIAFPAPTQPLALFAEVVAPIFGSPPTFGPPSIFAPAPVIESAPHIPAISHAEVAAPALGSIALLPVANRLCRCGLRHEVQPTRAIADYTRLKRVLLAVGIVAVASAATIAGLSDRRRGSRADPPPTDRVEFQIGQRPTAPAADVLGK